MAIFSVEIADEDVNRVIEALCANYGRKDEVLDDNNLTIPNPENKPEFANRMVRIFLKEHVKKYELDIAKQLLLDQIKEPTINDPQI